MAKPASLPSSLPHPIPVRDVLPSPYPHYPLTEAPRRRSNPCSLGLFAFAVTTFISAIQNIVWPLDSRNTIAGVAFIYGGAVQFIVGFMEHAAGNNFSGATFASFGAMWLGRAFCMFLSTGSVTTTRTQSVVSTTDAGLYAAYSSAAEVRHQQVAIDAGFTLFSITLTYIAAFVLRNGSRLLTLTLGAVCVLGVLGTISDMVDNDIARSALTRTNGVCMVIVAALAWYGAVNELCLEEGIKLPVGAHSRPETERVTLMIPPTISDFSARSSKDMV